jgi:ParB family chromosome partitioning protein
VLAVEGADEQVRFAREIAARGVTKSEAEQLAAARRSRPAMRRAPAVDIHLRGLAEELTRGFGTRVRIVRRSRGGSIEIEFYSDAELEGLVERLRLGTIPRTTSFDTPQ